VFIRSGKPDLYSWSWFRGNRVWLSVYKERKTRFVLVVRVSGQSGLAWFGSVFIKSGKPDLYSWSVFRAIGFGMVWLSVYKERKSRFVVVVRVSGQSGLAWLGSVFIRSGKPDLYSWSLFRCNRVWHGLAPCL
jgi:hypothetical protein